MQQGFLFSGRAFAIFDGMKLTAMLLLFLSITLHAQDFKKHVQYLASDSLEGRLPGTAGEDSARLYITKSVAWERTNLELIKFDTIVATNVFGVLNSNNDSTIIISAHYDHLGHGEYKSKEIIKKGIHNGADDNASGVAMALELAKELKPDTTLKYNYLFAFYSAHEPGLYGSAFFASSPLGKSLKIRAVLNFDMVGRFDETGKTIRISGAKTDSVFSEFFNKKDTAISYRFDDTNLLLSDLKPFAEMGLPVLNITTGIHDDYHKTTDDENKINYRGMGLIFNRITLLLQQIEKHGTD